ncbi:MAG: hypothetical protein IH946_03005 [Bacteroidetes bacterium]|nr:hypothetical protein [Bacteroidota bacterium]
MEENQDRIQQDPDEISLKEIVSRVGEMINYIISQWLPIAMVVLIIGSFGVAYSIMKGKTYVAKTTMMLEDSKTSAPLFQALSLAGQLGLGSGTADGEDKLVEIMQSRTVITMALLQEAEIDGEMDLLINHYIGLFGIREDLEDDGLGDFKFTARHIDELSFPEDSILNMQYGRIIDELLFLENSDIDVIMVLVESPNELFSKYLNEALVLAVKNFYISNITEKQVNMVKVLENRRDSIHTELYNSENKWAKLKDGSMGMIKMQGSLEELRRKRDIEILNVMYSEVVKNLEVAGFNLLIETPVIQVIDSPILPLKKKRLSVIFGFIYGGILGGFFSLLYVILKKLYQDFLDSSPNW